MRGVTECPKLVTLNLFQGPFFFWQVVVGFKWMLKQSRIKSETWFSMTNGILVNPHHDLMTANAASHHELAARFYQSVRSLGGNTG